VITLSEFILDTPLQYLIWFRFADWSD
jgi:hypothetical protein